MGIDKEDMQFVIKWLIMMPIILFLIDYSFGVVFCNNIYQYAHRYMTEISYGIRGEVLVEDVETILEVEDFN